jgi:hypothetical protein
MSDLTRYDISINNCGDGAEAEELYHGDWVYFTDADKRIKELEAENEELKSIKWVQDVRRKEDMSPRGFLQITRDESGDVVIGSYGMRDGLVQPCTPVEFCISSGGNRSPNTVRALIKLAEAMEKDNLENPIVAMKE